MDEQDRIRLAAMLKAHEGYRRHPYPDSRGILTIGYGRNLESVGISMLEASLLLDHDISEAAAALQKLEFWPRLNGPRQAALIDMTVNLGVGKLHQFVHMMAALAEEDYQTAGAQMLNALWARQVGGRARDLATMVITGEWPAGGSRTS